MCTHTLCCQQQQLLFSSYYVLILTVTLIKTYGDKSGKIIDTDNPPGLKSMINFTLIALLS